MNLDQYFKSIIDQDQAMIVICNLDHQIIYMNPMAIEKHQKNGSTALIGKSILLCHNEESQKKIQKVIEWFSKSERNNIVHTYFNEKHQRDVYMVALRDDQGKLIGYYEKHECRKKDESPYYDFQ